MSRADLDGDGAMEVLVRSQYWEAAVVEAFAWGADGPAW